MTLQEINTQLQNAENHNTKLAEGRRIYSERLKREFGVKTTEELKEQLASVESQLAAKNKEYEDSLNEAEKLLREAGVQC